MSNECWERYSIRLSGTRYPLLLAAGPPFPLAGPLDPPGAFWEQWWFWIILAGVLLVAAWLVGRPWRREMLETPGPAAPGTPWGRAFTRLNALEGEQLPENGGFETFYVTLSLIIREYTVERYGVPVMELSTPELISSMTGLLGETEEEMLARLLRHMDRVKFARYEPRVPDARQAMAHARRFVEATSAGAADQGSP